MEKKINSNKDTYVSPALKICSCKLHKIICASEHYGGYEEMAGGDTSDWF